MTSTDSVGRVSTIAALRYGDYRLLWGGVLVSNVGTWMQTFAIGWYVVELAVRDGVPDRGPLYLGLVGVSRAAPGLVAGIVAGTLADRFNRRRLLMMVQGSGAAIAAALAVLALVDRLGLIAVLIATGLSGAVGAFDGPARYAMVAGAVPRRALSSAIGLLLATQNVATSLGPLLGGVLIGAIGVGGLLVLNALSFVVILGAIFAMGPVAFDRAARHPNVLRSMQEGFAYAWHDPVIRPLLGLLVVTGVFGRALTQMLPAFAHDALHAGAIELSWLLGAAGFGALGGSMFSASLGAFSRRGLLVTVCAASSGVLLVAFARQTTLIPALVLVALTAVVLQLHITNHVTLYQTRAPAGFLGRVVGISSTLSGTAQALGALALGSLGTLAGINTAIGAGGVCLAIAALYILIRMAPLRDVGTVRDQLPIEAVVS